MNRMHSPLGSHITLINNHACRASIYLSVLLERASDRYRLFHFGQVLVRSRHVVWIRLTAHVLERGVVSCSTALCSCLCSYCCKLQIVTVAASVNFSSVSFLIIPFRPGILNLSAPTVNYHVLEFVDYLYVSE